VIDDINLKEDYGMRFYLILFLIFLSNSIFSDNKKELRIVINEFYSYNNKIELCDSFAKNKIVFENYVPLPGNIAYGDHSKYYKTVEDITYDICKKSAESLFGKKFVTLDFSWEKE